MVIVEPEFMALTADLDVEGFWQENDLCQEFTPDKPRCALSFAPDDHWLFEFVAVPSTLRYYRNKAYRDGLHRQVSAAAGTVPLRKELPPGLVPVNFPVWVKKAGRPPREAAGPSIHVIAAEKQRFGTAQRQQRRHRCRRQLFWQQSSQPPQQSPQQAFSQQPQGTSVCTMTHFLTGTSLVTWTGTQTS